MILIGSNGVLLAQSAVFDATVQQSFAATFLLWTVLRRIEKATPFRLLLVWCASAGATVVSPRMLVFVVVVSVAAVVCVWRERRRLEIVFLAPGVVVSAGVALIVAYRSSLAGDFATAELWGGRRSSVVVVLLLSTVVVFCGAFEFTTMSAQRRTTTATSANGRALLVLSCAVAGSVLVSVWSLAANGPVVWWGVPAVCLIGASMRGRGTAVLAAGSIVLISLVGWLGLAAKVDNAEALAGVVFRQARPGDQIVFSPGALRFRFERHRPAATFVPDPQYPAAPWGGFPGDDPVPPTLAPQVGERIADTATRVWIVTSDLPEDRAGTEATERSLGAAVSWPVVVDLRSGSLRIRCHEAPSG